MRHPRKLLTALPLAALLVTAVVQLAPGASAAGPACAAVPVSAPAGAKIESVLAEAKTGEPAYCAMTVTLTHPGAATTSRSRSRCQ